MRTRRMKTTRLREEDEDEEDEEDELYLPSKMRKARILNPDPKP